MVRRPGVPASTFTHTVRRIAKAMCLNPSLVHEEVLMLTTSEATFEAQTGSTGMRWAASLLMAFAVWLYRHFLAPSADLGLQPGSGSSAVRLFWPYEDPAMIPIRWAFPRWRGHRQMAVLRQRAVPVTSKDYPAKARRCAGRAVRLSSGGPPRISARVVWQAGLSCARPCRWFAKVGAP